MYTLGNIDDFIMRRIKKWKYSFAFLPKKCRLSNKTIWLEYAYKGKYTFVGPHDGMLSETYWHKTDEHLIWEFKR
jgi:hypothetical protein